jgi:hypothetical protein
MKTQAKSRRDEVAEHILELVKVSAKRRGCRVKKLGDSRARESVINGAAWRLMQSYAVFGNIRDYIEGGFWYEDGDARNKLIDRALDAERKAYIRASDRAAWGEIAPYAVAFTPVKLVGLKLLPANSVTDVIEQEEYFKDEAAAEDVREQEAAKEFEIMREAINVYSETLRLAHRQALKWICNEPKLTNSTIAAKVGMTSVRGISQATVAKIRDKFGEMADKFLVLMNPEDFVENLLRKVERLQEENAVLQAERRRDLFLRDHSPEEFEALRAWAAPFCEALGSDVDSLLGASIAPKAGS